MNKLLKIILSLSLSGALLILVLLFCKPLVKDKFSKRWQYYIWLIAVARLLLPFAPETNLMGTLFQHFGNTMIQTDASLQAEQKTPALPEAPDQAGNGVREDSDPGGVTASGTLMSSPRQNLYNK